MWGYEICENYEVTDHYDPTDYEGNVYPIVYDGEYEACTGDEWYLDECNLRDSCQMDSETGECTNNCSHSEDLWV